MSTNRTAVASVAVWMATVVIALAARALLVSQPFSSAESLVWTFVVTGPIAVCLLVFRGASSPTIAQVLYNTEQTGDETRRTGGRS